LPIKLSDLCPGCYTFLFADDLILVSSLSQKQIKRKIDFINNSILKVSQFLKINYNRTNDFELNKENITQRKKSIYPKANLFKFNIENDLDSYVEIYWIDFDGKEIYYSNLRPGSVFSEDSYYGYEWMIKNDKIGAIDFRLGSGFFTTFNPYFKVSQLKNKINNLKISEIEKEKVAIKQINKEDTVPKNIDEASYKCIKKNI
jgi:hypothetical protein